MTTLRCRLFGHDWGDWKQPYAYIEQDGLDINIVDGEIRRCNHCHTLDSRPLEDTNA